MLLNFEGENSRGEDLLEACERLSALGETISYLGLNSEPDQLAENCLKNLGDSIVDYVSAIRQTLEEVKGLIDKHFTYGGVSLLCELEKNKEDIESSTFGHFMNAGTAKKSVEKIEHFMSGDLVKIKELKGWFEQTGKTAEQERMTIEALEDAAKTARRCKKAHATSNAA